MADAQATFAITFDTSQLQASAKAGDSALERQAAMIKRVSKDLDGLKAAQKRLLASASVKQYLAQQKAIEATQRKAAGLEKKLAAAQENLDIAKQANVAPEDMSKLAADVDKYRLALEEAGDELERLEQAQSKLSSSDDAVKAFKDKSTVINKQEGDLADLQAQFDRLGGSLDQAGEGASGAAAEIKGAGEGTKGLLDAVKGANPQVGGLIEKLSKIKGAGAAGAIGLIVVAVVALVTILAKATIALVRFGLAAADAFRSARIARQGAANGAEAGAKEIEGAMTAIRTSTAASREEASQLASELYRLGYRGKALENAAVTIERFGVAGEEAKSQVKALYEQLAKPAPPGMRGIQITADMLPRDQFKNLAKALGRDANKALHTGIVANRAEVANALKKIGAARFGDLAASQMLSLSKLSERLKENLEDLFDGLKIDVFLGALRKIVMLFDKSTSSGKALRRVAEIALQPMFNTLSKLAPLAEGFIEGVTFGLLLIALVALKARNAFNKLFPGDFLSNLDLAEVGFYLAAFAVGAVVAGLLALAAVLAIVAVAVGLVMLPFLILGAVAAAVIYGIVAAFDYLKSIDLYEIGVNIWNSLVKGINSGVAAVGNAVSDLASAAKGAIKDALGIASPSKVFRAYGRFTAEGFEQGVDEAAPAASETTAQLGAAPPAPSVGGRGGGGSMPSEVHIHVHAPNLTKARELTDPEFLRRVVRAFWTIAREGGGPTPQPAR